MNYRSLALVVFCVPAVALPLPLGCGGKTGGGGGDGGPASSSGSGGGSGSGSSGGSGSSSGSSSGGISSSSSGSSSGGEPIDATPVIDSPAPIVCMNAGMSGSGGQGSCDIGGSETCSDGNMYSVDCQCPQGTCTCTQTSANGGSSGGGFSYPGCPDCTTGDIFTICGFPQ